MSTRSPTSRLSSASRCTGTRVAAFGHVPVSFRTSGATAMSISGHKLGAPIGTGALLVRRGAEPVRSRTAAGSSRPRSGTIDVAGAVALSVAA